MAGEKYTAPTAQTKPGSAGAGDWIAPLKPIAWVVDYVTSLPLAGYVGHGQEKGYVTPQTQVIASVASGAAFLYFAIHSNMAWSKVPILLWLLPGVYAFFR